ncbi:MAG: nuclear transport factor 2 family protein, partial [Flavobacteriaceae bacterium]|nr:nuclear transport factor 2 family protein [Flavobacteriaceae bacterium]
TGIDVQGYPDYLNYGLGNAKVVQSWWKVRMTRKSDKKEIVLPLMLIHDFNDEGKITRDNAYYSQSMMNAK